MKEAVVKTIGLDRCRAHRQPDCPTRGGERLQRRAEQFARAGDLVRTRRGTRTESPRGDGRRRGEGRRRCRGHGAAEELPGRSGRAAGGQDRDRHEQLLSRNATALSPSSTTSRPRLPELLQAHLPTSRVVKAFNHIYAAALTTDGQPAGTKNRRALAIAGDDREAKATVTGLLDRFGFDTVDAGSLKEGWRFQRDTPGYGPRRTAEELRRDLAAAKRYADR